MPAYDFTCMVCDKTTEFHLPFDNSDAPYCEVCGHKMLKVYSAPGVHFKGSGWGGQ